MHLWTQLYLKWRGVLVGTDQTGNRYFEEKTVSRGNKKRRFVLYKGKEEASKVPALWHAWLHYTSDSVPTDVTHYHWENNHMPNLTGTPFAHNPKKSHIKGDGTFVNPDYEAWTPGVS